MHRLAAAVAVLAVAAGCIDATVEPGDRTETLVGAASGPAPHDLSYEGNLTMLSGPGLRLDVATDALDFAEPVATACDLASPRGGAVAADLGLRAGLALRQANATFAASPGSGPDLGFRGGGFTLWGSAPVTASAPLRFNASQAAVGAGAATALPEGDGAGGTVEVGPGAVTLDGVWVQAHGPCDLRGPGALTLQPGRYPFTGHLGARSGTVAVAFQAEEPAVLSLGATVGVVTSPKGLRWDPPRLDLLAYSLEGTVDAGTGAASLAMTVDQAWSRSMMAFRPDLRLSTLGGADQMIVEVPRGGEADAWVTLTETSGQGAAVEPVLLALGDDLGDDVTVSLSRSLLESTDTVPAGSDFVPRRRVFWDGDDGHTLDTVGVAAHGHLALRVQADDGAPKGVQSFGLELHSAGERVSQPFRLHVKVV